MAKPVSLIRFERVDQLMSNLGGRACGRRRLLASMVCGGAVAVAGCLSGTDDESNGDESNGDPDPSYAGRTPYMEEDHPIDEPVEFTEDHDCPVCQMRVARYTDWRAQLAHEDGTGIFFDTPGCLLAYYVDYELLDSSEAPIETVWLTDFETGRMFEAGDGYLVRETDFDRHQFPMGGSPIPFSSRDDAEAYTDEYDDLSADDVITLDEVDRELALEYRQSQM